MPAAYPPQVLAPIYYVFCLELEWARKAQAEAAAAECGDVAAELDPEEEEAANAAGQLVESAVCPV